MGGISGAVRKMVPADVAAERLPGIAAGLAVDAAGRRPVPEEIREAIEHAQLLDGSGPRTARGSSRRSEGFGGRLAIEIVSALRPS